MQFDHFYFFSTLFISDYTNNHDDIDNIYNHDITDNINNHINIICYDNRNSNYKGNGNDCDCYDDDGSSNDDDDDDDIYNLDGDFD